MICGLCISKVMDERGQFNSPSLVADLRLRLAELGFEDLVLDMVSELSSSRDTQTYRIGSGLRSSSYLMLPDLRS
jgi:hypothetical protein